MESWQDAMTEATVLVVDDEAANRLLLERMLDAIGVGDVHLLSDPRVAVQRCLELDADLVLLDLHMPHMDGFEVMGRLQEALPDGAFLPVLVLTADITPETRIRALEAGAKDFVTKPLDYLEVSLRVRNLLETRSLYATVERHNRVLQAELAARAENDRLVEEENERRSQRLDSALTPGAIKMVFQPVADLRTGEVVGVEALARFQVEPTRAPDVWFNEAAEAGRGTELELAAVSAALLHLDNVPSDAFLSVNLSPLTAVSPTLLAVLEGVATDRVVLEMTEHAPVQDYPTLVVALDELRRRGARVAVDDTGTGYAGLDHILRLRPDILKLDTALTRGIDTDPARRALALALVAFARDIGCQIIAEGVETAEELEALRELEVPWGQGYHLARPGPLPTPDKPRIEEAIQQTWA